MIAPTRAASRTVPMPSLSPNSFVTAKMIMAETMKLTRKKTAAATSETAMVPQHPGGGYHPFVAPGSDSKRGRNRPDLARVRDDTMRRPRLRSHARFGHEQSPR